MSSVRVVPETRLMSGDELSADDAWPTVRRYGALPLLRDGFLRFRYGDGFSHGRAFALQFALAVVPMVIAGAGLSIALGGETLGEVVARTVVAVSPGDNDDLVRDAVAGRTGAEQDDDAGEPAFTIGLVTAFVAATMAFAQLERGANRIYGTERDRPVLRKYARAALLTATAGVAMAVGLLLIVAGGPMGDALTDGYGWSDSTSNAFEIFRWPSGLLALVVAVTLLFRFAPRRRQPSWSWLAVGAAVTVAGWVLWSGALGVYVDRSGSIDDTYGSLTAVIALLLWSNLSGIALLAGIALAAQLEAFRTGQTDPRLPDSDDDGIPDILDIDRPAPLPR